MQTATDGRTALLLIDIQQAMFGPDEVCHAPETLVATVQGLLERARGDGVPVFEK